MFKTQKLGKTERVSFSKIEEVLPLPNLLEIQKASYEWFLKEGLNEVLRDVSPITDYSNNLVIEFIVLIIFFGEFLISLFILFLVLFIRCIKEGINEHPAVKGLKVVYLFAYADELHRNSEFVLYGDNDAALSCSIQLSKDNTGDRSCFAEQLCLIYGILSCGSIEYQQDLSGAVPCLGIDDPVDLRQLIHKVLLVVKTSGGVDDDHIARSCLRSFKSVINNSSGV